MPTETAGIPADVTDFLHDYLDAFRSGPDVSVHYVYFPPERDNSAAYAASIDWLVDASVQKAETINENLYAFLISYTMASTVANGKEPETVWNYVGWIDGAYRVITNSRNIPEALRDGFSERDYANPQTDETRLLIEPDEVMF